MLGTSVPTNDGCSKLKRKVGKARGTRAWLLLEVSRGGVFALQSCFPLSRLWSCTSSASSVALSGKKMVFPCRDAAVVGDVHRQYVSQFFHLISVRLCWQMTTVFYLLPHQGAARPRQVLLCQHPTSMAALSPGSQPPGSHLHKLILCHSETPVLL